MNETQDKSEFLEAIEAHCSCFESVATGVSPGCADCREAYDYCCEHSARAAWESGEWDDEGGFSWSQCDSCGSALGGNRYDAHGIERNEKTKEVEVFHLSICADCLMFHANGDEPETWEG